MAIKQIVGIVFLFAGAFSTNVAVYLARTSVKISGAELQEQYPARAWIRYAYPFLYVVIFFGGAFLFLLSVNRSEMVIFEGENWFFMMGGVLGLIPLFNGIFALLTGTLPINRRRQHLYVVDEEITHQVGFILIGVGVGFILAAALSILFW